MTSDPAQTVENYAERASDKRTKKGGFLPMARYQK